MAVGGEPPSPKHGIHPAGMWLPKPAIGCTGGRTRNTQVAQMKRIWSSESGTSLVEILITMVVLVLGILTIVRIYPLGFTNLQHTEDITVAQRLAQAEVDRWKAEPDSLPDMIAAVDPTSTPIGMVLDPTVRPDDLEPHPGLPNGLDPTEWSDVNKTRKILGEVAHIPPPVPTPFGDASVYTLGFGPIEWPAQAVTTTDQADPYIQVYGAALTGVDVAGLDPESKRQLLANLGLTRYAIDYGRAMLAVAATPYPRQFKVDYSYRVRDGQIRTVTGDIINVPAQTSVSYIEAPLGVINRGSPVFDPDFLPGSNGGIEPGSESVSPKFRYVPPGRFSTNDYMQFSVLGTMPATGQFVATVAFHPRASVQLRGTNVGGQPIPAIARIDYQVADWHVLREDKTVPAVPPYNVRLALPFIKQAGVTAEEGRLASPTPTLGVYQGVVKSLPGISVVAVDPEDGSMAFDRDPRTNTTYFEVDFRTGTVHLPATMDFYQPQGTIVERSVAGRALRFYYQAEGDWAVAVQKAAASYQPVAAAVPVLPYESCLVTQPILINGAYQVTVLFPLADQGKSVVLNYSYWDKRGEKHTVYGVNAQISDRDTPGLQPIPGSSRSPEHPYIRLVVANQQDMNPQAGVELSEVRGTSLRAITIWREGNRWKHQEVSTYLTRQEQ